MILTTEKTGRFITILADGKLHETVNKDADGAVLREYETSDGKKGEKYELVYTKLEGFITDVGFHTGDFGEQVQITFTDGDNEVILSQGVASNFGEDLLKKLPNVAFSEKVTVSPYAFENEQAKPVRGVTLYQKGEKLFNYFWDFEGKKEKNGYPAPDGDTKEYDADLWKIHFIKARKFLVNYTKENIVPKFNENRVTFQLTHPDEIKPIGELNLDEVNAAEIPF